MVRENSGRPKNEGPEIQNPCRGSREFLKLTKKICPLAKFEAGVSGFLPGSRYSREAGINLNSLYRMNKN